MIWEAPKEADLRLPICSPRFDRDDCGRDEGPVSINGNSTAVCRPDVPIGVRVAGMAICGTVPGRRPVGIV